MKRNRLLFAFFFLLLVAFLLLSVSADVGEGIWIQGHNLKLSDHVSMIYYVGAENLPGGSSFGVAIFRSEQEDYLLEEADALLDTYGGTQVAGTQTFYKFYYEGLADCEMGDVLYARPYYITQDGNLFYGAVDSYSVLQYAMEQTGKTGYTANTALAPTLEWLLEEGAKAQIAANYKTDRLVTGSFGFLSLQGAVLPDGSSSQGCFSIGESVTLTGLGGEIGWFNEAGERIASGKTYQVIVTAEPQSYVAVCEAHEFVEEEISGATCTEPALHRYVCACGEQNGEPFTVGEAPGHDYVETVIAATCTEAGYTSHTCSRCGDSYTDNESAALGHNFRYWTGICTRCGYSNVIYTSNGDGTCRVTGMHDPEAVFVIVAEKSPNGDTVTSIAENAFVGTMAEELLLPATIELIEENAFYDVPIMAVYYMGTLPQWEAIPMEGGNGSVYYADVYYYRTSEPAATGNFWHWVSGALTIWPPVQDDYGEIVPL